MEVCEREGNSKRRRISIRDNRIRREKIVIDLLRSFKRFTRRRIEKQLKS
jgi:hypothetical protein